MEQQQATDFQLQQYSKEEKPVKEQKLDEKNAVFIEHIDQPNHPNT